MKHIYVLEVYQGRGRGWYWRLKSGNGLTIADGAEGYSTASNAMRAARRLVEIMREVWAGTIGVDIRTVE